MPHPTQYRSFRRRERDRAEAGEEEQLESLSGRRVL